LFKTYVHHKFLLFKTYVHHKLLLFQNKPQNIHLQFLFSDSNNC
jgi:hypothetical protein